MIYKVEAKGNVHRKYNFPEETKRVLKTPEFKYYYVPDDKTEGVTAPLATEDEVKSIKNLSSVSTGSDKLTADEIRKQYSLEEELRCLRLGRGTEEFRLYNEYVEQCVAQGKARKRKFGL